MRNGKYDQMGNIGESRIRIPKRKGVEERRVERRDKNDGGPTSESNLSAECESATTNAAFDARK